MSFTYNFAAIIEPDEKYHRMKAVYDACKAAGIAVPDEVCDFFNGEPPNVNGTSIPLGWSDGYGLKGTAGYGPPAMEVSKSGAGGWEIVLEHIPKGATRIHFYVGG